MAIESTTLIPTNHPPSLLSKIVAVILGLTAIGLATFGMVANASYMAAFGTGYASGLLVLLAGAIEVLALSLPTVAAMQHDRRSAVVAWVLWLPCVFLVTINSCGFSSKFIGDSIEARTQVTDQKADRKEELQNLKTQRKSVTELRAVTELDAAISKLQASKRWSLSDECKDPGRHGLESFCQTYQQARMSRESASQRDSLDSKIHALETDLANAPAIAQGDAGAATAADIVQWVSFGRLHPSVHDFAIMRIIVFTFAPAFGGLLLGLAVRLVKGGAAQALPFEPSKSSKPSLRRVA